MTQSLTLKYHGENYGTGSRRYVDRENGRQAGKADQKVVLLSSALFLDKPIKLSERKIYKVSAEEHDILLGSLFKSVSLRKKLTRP